MTTRFLSVNLAMIAVVGTLSADIGAAAAPRQQASLDFGGGRSVGGDWIVDSSLTSFTGVFQEADSQVIARQGFVGQLNESPITSVYLTDRPKDCSLRISAALLLDRCVDAEGNRFTVTSVSWSSDKGAGVALDGAWVCYLPPVGFAGVDSLAYTVEDEFGSAAQGWVTIRTVDSPYAPPPGRIAVELRGALSDGSSVVRTHLPTAPRVFVEVSTNLIAWVPSWTNAPQPEVVDFADPSAISHPIRFYRVSTSPIEWSRSILSRMLVTPEREARFLISWNSPTPLGVEASSDLLQWLPVATHLTHRRVVEFVDGQIANAPNRYHRAFTLP